MLKRKKKVVIIGGGTAGLTIYSDLRKYFHVTVFDKADIEKVSFFYRVPLFIGLLFSKKNKYVSKVEIPAHDGRLILFLSLVAWVEPLSLMAAFMWLVTLKGKNVESQIR